MAFETISDGLTIQIPTSGTTNWAQQIKLLCWKVISSHRHEGSGNGLQIRTQGLVDGAVTSAKLADNIAFTQSTAVAPTGTTATIDWDDGNKAILDLSSATGTVILTLSNPQSGGSYRIKLIQGSTARVVTWPAAVLWPGGVEATQHTNASTVNLINLDYDGTNYLADWSTEIA